MVNSAGHDVLAAVSLFLFFRISQFAPYQFMGY
jgi:hypothetical protein